MANSEYPYQNDPRAEQTGYGQYGELESTSSAQSVPKKSAEERIASGEVDADHLVKWGDLKNLK